MKGTVLAAIRSHLKHNGDWNVNDWRDVTEKLLADYERAVKSIQANHGHLAAVGGSPCACEWCAQ